MYYTVRLNILPMGNIVVLDIKASERGVYEFSSLMKQNKKAKICAVFCFAKKNIFYLFMK